MAGCLSFSLNREQETAPADVKGYMYAEASKKIRHSYEDKNDLQQDTGLTLYHAGSRHHTRSTREGKGLSAIAVTFISPDGGSRLGGRL